ncbi:MAG: hypothetical protein K6T88_22815 [Bacillus sp. (in: Bacteria)]|nr:hypothetical protein [Bacillus sp. (in: firmicutes)]
METYVDSSNIVRYICPEIPPGWNTLQNPQKGFTGDMKTYSYFTVDEVSSAAQKAVRRGKYIEAIQWVLEMFWTGPAVRTNIWNRCLVMSVEDIGPANPYVVLGIWKLYQKYPQDPLAIATAAVLLAQSPKSRVNDWATHMFKHLQSNTLGTPLQMKKCLVDSLKRKDVNETLKYATGLHFTDQPISGKYKKAIWYIWEALDEVSNRHSYIQILIDIGMSPNWRWQDKSRLLYVHGIHLFCTNRLPNDVSYTIEPVQDLASIVEMFKKRENIVGIPDYAIDKHTIKGKSLGRGLHHFLKEGCILENEDCNWKELSQWYLYQIFLES